MSFADLEEAALHAKPEFPVEHPGKPPVDAKTWPEAFRQRWFVSYVRKHAPKMMVFSIANEGKRSTFGGKRMKAQGLTPGIPDVCCLWTDGMAFIEFKGFSASGSPGRLSDAQIEACNKIHRNGHPVACFFTATAAINWLHELGAPIGRVTA